MNGPLHGFLNCSKNCYTFANWTLSLVNKHVNIFKTPPPPICSLSLWMPLIYFQSYLKANLIVDTKVAIMSINLHGFYNPLIRGVNKLSIPVGISLWNNKKYTRYRQLAIMLRIIAIAITIMAKKVIDYCNNY